MWLRSLLSKIGLTEGKLTELYCDNNKTIASTHDPHKHSRVKHINIQYHYIWNCINKGHIEVKNIWETENVVDIMTKALRRTVHALTLKMLRIEPLSGSQGSVEDRSSWMRK